MRKRHRRHGLLPSASTEATNLTRRMNILEKQGVSLYQEGIRPAILQRQPHSVEPFPEDYLDVLLVGTLLLGNENVREQTD